MRPIRTRKITPPKKGKVVGLMTLNGEKNGFCAEMKVCALSKSLELSSTGFGGQRQVGGILKCVVMGAGCFHSHCPKSVLLPPT